MSAATGPVIAGARTDKWQPPKKGPKSPLYMLFSVDKKPPRGRACCEPIPLYCILFVNAYEI